MVFYPGTTTGWALLLGIWLVLSAVAFVSGGLNPVAVFLVVLILGAYPIRAWERRRADGRHGLPGPVDVFVEPMRTAREYSTQFEGSRVHTDDKIISAGILLMALAALVGVPLLFGRELVAASFLGDLQPGLAGMMFVGGALIAVLRYVQRGRWR